MLDPELAARLDALQVKVDAAYKAAHRTQQYLFWTGVATVALIVLPAIALAFLLPSFISTYTDTYSSLLNGQPPSSQSQTQSAQTMQLLRDLGL